MQTNFPLVRSWLTNLWRSRVERSTLLAPMGVTWHATNCCNFRCRFCDDGKGNRYPELDRTIMSTAEVKEVLSLARKRVGVLYITGGEPLVRKDLREIVRWAKHDARYRYIGMVTNGVLLHKQEELLADVDDLTISLHTLDEDWGDRTLGAGPGTTAEIVRAVLRYGSKRRVGKYRFSVSCVVMPERIDDARAVMRFCFSHGIYFAVMPQSVKPYPHEALVDNAEYKAFIDEVIACKRAGEPVWGSCAYFENIRDFTKFKCYPTTVPRILPNGDLVYPCSPLGTVAGNLVGASSFDAVLAEGVRRHGAVPGCDTRCFAQCYIESSHSIEFPVQLLWDNLVLFYKTSRAAGSADN